MPELLLKILHTAGIDYCCILAEVLDGDDGPQFGTPAPTSWSQLLLGLGAPAGAESRCHQLVLRRVGGNGGDTGRGRQAMGLYVGWGMGEPTCSKMFEVTGRVKFQRYFKGI